MAACLITPEIQENRSAQRRHEQIMRRFHAVIEDNIGDAIYVPDLCAAMNVPERTLRTCCMESLNMGPMQFLHRRRLQLARRDLRKADPAVTRVTDIAMRYGFWEFGRFSVAYRHLFGEPPSTTLRRPLA
jgi:AraC-like DNA-binding protein